MDESPKRGLLAAYRRLLRPLVRILIRNGVSFPEFAEVAKEAYVEVAQKSFSVPNRDSSDFRISALTGIQRKEAQALVRSLRSSPIESSNTLDGIVRVLTAWHTDSDFTGPYGVPFELDFEDNNKPDFVLLAKRYFNEIGPKELLAKLTENGLVRETKKDCYKVLARNYRPEGNAPDGLEHLARTFQDMVNILDHNRLEDSPRKRLFERQVYTEDGIREEDLPIFQDYVTGKANILLEEIDNWLSQLSKPNEPKSQRINTGLGIYNYVHRGEDE